MTTLMVWDGQLLARNGNLAIGAACCCNQCYCPSSIDWSFGNTCATWNTATGSATNNGSCGYTFSNEATADCLHSGIDWTLQCTDGVWTLSAVDADSNVYGPYTGVVTQSPWKVTFQVEETFCCSGNPETVEITETP